MRKKNFQTLKNQIIHAIIEAPAVLKQQTKELVAGKTIDDITKIHSAELTAIKQELQEHKSGVETSGPAMAAAKRDKAGKGRAT